MDQLIKAVALLIEKNINMMGLTVDDIKVLNDVRELARALDESTPEGELNTNTIHAIREGYEKYVIGRLTTSYNLANWYTQTSGRTLTDQQVIAILEADVDVVHGLFSVICNNIITGVNKERT